MLRRRGAIGTSSGGESDVVMCLFVRWECCDNERSSGRGSVCCWGRAGKLAHTIQIRKRPRDTPSHPWTDGTSAMEQEHIGQWSPVAGVGENGGSQGPSLAHLLEHTNETWQRFRHHQVHVQARGRDGLSSRRDFEGHGVGAQGDHLHLPQVNKSRHLLRRKLPVLSARERCYIQARFSAPPDRHMGMEGRYFTN